MLALPGTGEAAPLNRLGWLERWFGSSREAETASERRLKVLLFGEPSN